MMNFQKERIKMVSTYSMIGILHSHSLIKAMLKVPRELFMPTENKRSSYEEKYFNIPGNGWQTISSPSIYPLFYENLKLGYGDRILEVGTGSGYGAAIAREVVGTEGKVVTIEINKETYQFAKNNLRKAGYHDIIVIPGDGSKGFKHEAPYDKICITAATPEIPQPLIDQLGTSGKLICPVGPPKYIMGQDLFLLEKFGGEIRRKKLSKVLHVPLVGKYGWKNLPSLKSIE